jgi:hypothetical protein
MSLFNTILLNIIVRGSSYAINLVINELSPSIKHHYYKDKDRAEKVIYNSVAVAGCTTVAYCLRCFYNMPTIDVLCSSLVNGFRYSIIFIPVYVILLHQYYMTREESFRYNSRLFFDSNPWPKTDEMRQNAYDRIEDSIEELKKGGFL